MIEFDVLRGRDFGVFETFELPMRKQGVTLILGDNRDTTAADSNGSGKSTLFRALSWVIYGDTIEGDKTDEVVRLGAKSATVELSFIADHASYTIIRKRSKSAQSLQLYHGGIEISGATTRDTQEKINRMLGMDFRTFTNTVLYGEGDIHHFADPNTTDAERKSVLKRILRLEVIDGARDAMKKVERTLLDKKELAERKLPVLKARIEGLGLERVETLLAELRGRATEIKSKSKKLPKLLTVEKSALNLLDEYARTSVTIATLQKRRDAESAKLSFARFERVGAEQASAKVQLEAERYADGACPTCGTPAAASEHVAKELERLATELDAAEARVEKGKSEQEKWTGVIEATDAEISDLKASISDQREWEENLRTVRAEIADLRAIEKTGKTAAEDIAKQLKVKAELLKQREDLVEEHTEVAAELAGVEIELRHVQFWLKGFGNSGLPSHRMDEEIPGLESRANHYLDILSDGDIKVHFDTESKLKSGEVRDKFGIWATIEGQEAVRPSKGQRRKITVATDLALMDLVASREHASVDLLCLDEILDGLDRAGKARVMTLLLELRKYRGSIFVISHDPELAEIFEKTVTVVKEGNVARID